MKHELTGQNLINGHWTASQSAQTYTALNPATGQALAPAFSVAAQAEVDAALALAKQTFDRSHELPPRWQAALLDRIADCINDLGDTLLDRGQSETALPKPRLAGERARTTGQLKMFANFVREGSWVDATIDTADPNRTPAPRPDLRRMLRPRGPAVVFGASNFPFAFGVCGGDTASALAAGCPVVVKGHPSHPGVNELFAAAVLEAINALKLPAGLFALIQGKSHDLGAMLVKHPATTAVGFTGSRTAGRSLFNLAAARPTPIPVYAEMGSLNPLVILPGALQERAAKIGEGLAASVLLGAGQFCTKPGLIFLLEGNDHGFIEALNKQMSAAAPFTMLNKTLRDSFCQGATSFTTIPGVKALITGKPDSHASMSAMLFETAAETWLKEPRLHEEIFGPGALIVRCNSLDQLLACLPQLGGSLTGTIHIGKDENTAMLHPILRALESLCGRVITNGYPTGVEVGHAIVHGGPYPATTDPGWTSVGSAAIRRFARMIAYQDTPEALLPPELQSPNPLHIHRTINGERTAGAI